MGENGVWCVLQIVSSRSPLIVIMISYIFCLFPDEVPLENALSVTTYLFPNECLRCPWWSGKRLVAYFFVSKHKLIMNLITLEWRSKNANTQNTSNYLSSSTVSLLICHSCFFPYMKSCQILWKSIYSNIIWQKIFNLTLKPFKFTSDHFKFCWTIP